MAGRHGTSVPLWSKRGDFYHGRMNTISAKPAQYPTARVKTLPLHVHDVLKHAARVHAAVKVTSIALDGAVECQSYAELAVTARDCAAQLHALGFQPGDALVSFGLSSLDQMAWLYGALDQGVVTHLLNPQHRPEDLGLFLQQIRPKLVLHDAATAGAVQAFQGLLPGSAVRAMTHRNAEGAVGYVPAQFPEDTLSHVCYSSGTTGTPKVVEYTHRSTLLHTWACALPDAMGLTGADRVMPLMQNFHASAWGAPFVCPMVGAELILVPPTRDPAQWFQWIEEHRVTVLGAVSAHWLALARYMQATGQRFSTLRRTVVGGTRLPFEVAYFIQEQLGVEVCHAWGMTETSPLATIERFDSSATVLAHGKPVFGIELAVRGDDAVCAAEGAGELMVRGHWVAGGSGQHDWLATGDFATLQADGRLDVSDRLSDSLLVSGIPLSSALVEHRARQVPGVADAALVICEPGSGHSVLAWVAAPDAEPDTAVAELQAVLAQAFEGWCPTRCTVVDAFPYTASAKVQKHLLKAQIAPQNESDVAPTLPSRADA